MNFYLYETYNKIDLLDNIWFLIWKEVDINIRYKIFERN